MGALRRFEMEPKSRDDAGGGGESARYSGGTPCVRAPELGHNVKNG